MTFEQKMKHVSKHIKNKHYSIKMDFAELQDKKAGCTEFFWFVRQNGTTLIPSPHIFIKDSTFNLMGRQMSEIEGVRVYFIRVKEPVEGKLDGEIRVISDIKKYMDKLTGYPVKMTGTIIMKDGDEICETIDYTSDFFDEFVRKCEDKKCNLNKSNIKALYLNEIEF